MLLATPMGFSTFRPTKTTHLEPEHALDGLTLYALLEGPAAWLVDNHGELVHAWEPPDPTWRTYSAELLPNGNLFLLCMTDHACKPGGSGAIVELDPKGNVVWCYENEGLHHAAIRQANGNNLLLFWEPMPDAMAKRYCEALGPDKEPLNGTLLGDIVREMTPAGEVLWEWRAWEHLDVHEDAACQLHKLDEWTHCNSVDLTPNGDLVVCFRINDTVGIVDRRTGDFRWKWGPGVIGHAHDISALPNGNVLMFDNHWHFRGALDESRAIEVSPRTGEIVWAFHGAPTCSLFSAHLGACQRLPNGNTLISEGTTGRVFEVTPDQRIVWEYITPFACQYRDDPASTRTPKFRKYARDAACVAPYV